MNETVPHASATSGQSRPAATRPDRKREKSLTPPKPPFFRTLLGLAACRGTVVELGSGALPRVASDPDAPPAETVATAAKRPASKAKATKTAAPVPSGEVAS